MQGVFAAVIQEVMADITFVNCTGDKDKIVHPFCNGHNGCGISSSGVGDQGGQLVQIHISGVDGLYHTVDLVDALVGQNLLQPIKPCGTVGADVLQGEVQITDRTGTQAIHGLGDGETVAGEVEIFGLAVVLRCRSDQGFAAVVIVREHRAVVDLLEGDFFISEQQAELSRPSFAGTDEFPPDGSKVGAPLFFTGHGTVDGEVVGLADSIHAAQILDDCVAGEIEGQVDEIPGIVESFILGCGIELEQLIHIEAVHSLGQIVQLVQIQELVCQHRQSGRFLNRQNEDAVRVGSGRVQLFELGLEFAVAAGEFDIRIVIAPSDGNGNHSVRPSIPSLAGVDAGSGDLQGSDDEVVHLRGDDPVVGQLTEGHGLGSDADVLGTVDEDVLVGSAAGVRHIRKENLVLENMRLDFAPQPPLGGQQIDCGEYLGIRVASVFDSFPEELTVDFACKIHGCYLAFWNVIRKQKSRSFVFQNDRLEIQK